jgi:hypothetical protein
MLSIPKFGHPDFSIMDTVSRLGWTGPNLHYIYIFLTTRTEVPYESVTRDYNDNINRPRYILTSSVKISLAEYFAASLHQLSREHVLFSLLFLF